jgi:hypothetical protein
MEGGQFRLKTLFRIGIFFDKGNIKNCHAFFGSNVKIEEGEILCLENYFV